MSKWLRRERKKSCSARRIKGAPAETASSPGCVSVAAERSLTGGRQNSFGRKKADCSRALHANSSSLSVSLFPVRVRVLEGGQHLNGVGLAAAFLGPWSF